LQKSSPSAEEKGGQGAPPEKSKVNLGRQLLTALVAIVFVYFAFRGANLKEVLRLTQEADPLFLLLTSLSALLSHVFRAYRWLILLKPLSPRKISFFHSFSAIIYGYAVNIVIPRGGEIVRLLSMSKSEEIPWAGVLSTLLIDRLLDVAFLALLLGATLTILPSSILNSMPWLLPGGATMTVVTLIGLIALPKLDLILNWFLEKEFVRKVVPEALRKKLEALLVQFGEGTKALTNPIAYPAIAGFSAIIWFFYWLNNYFIVRAFHLENHVSLKDTIIVFTVGSVGVLVPTPGSIGSFHFLVSQALILTCGLTKDLALAYATVLHVLAFVVVSVVGSLFCLAYQALSSRKAV
jgi:uncharacterized protein (TIRG00374 family)